MEIWQNINVDSLEMGLIVLGYYWVGLSAAMGKGPAYEFADKADLRNPLYAGGCIRKNAKNDVHILSNLKGIYLFQIIWAFFAVISFIYIGVCKNRMDEFCEKAEPLLVAGMRVLLVLWTLMLLYYIFRYERAFAYSENERGIWMPFQYLIHRQYESWSYEGFAGRCKTTMDKVEEVVSAGLKRKNYRKVAEYELEDGEKYTFYIRKKKNVIEIFGLMYMDELQETHMDKCNLIFEDFWIKNQLEKYKKEKINFIACMCIQKKSEWLEKIVSMHGTSYKAGRGRILALIYPRIGNRAWLRVLGTRREISRRKLHYWAIRELKEMFER